MKEEYELEIDEIAVGLTRPPTQFGVPLVAFYSSAFSCFLGWIFFQALISTTSLLSGLLFFMIWLALYVWMFFISLSDPFGLQVRWINFLYFRSYSTANFWGNTDSYRP